MLEVLTCLLATFCCCQGVQVVRRLSDIPQDNYGRQGLSHMTVAGALHHGFKEVEVWLQTFAPGSRTPIHRHDCEEIFLILKGRGTVYLASDSERCPGRVSEFSIMANTTVTIPVNAVHQIVNTDTVEELQFFVIISRPPIRVFVYQNWSTPHPESVLHFPYPWDMNCPSDLNTHGHENEPTRPSGSCLEIQSWTGSESD